ncbi:hypothetical protein EI94DRAFT_1794040 [Lactarius quietus]|nr:hypothetical protein EI94DRAFT_1794040 [Lactarius quietus]
MRLIGNSNQPKDNVDNDNPKFDALLAESVSSGSKYNGSNGSESGTHSDGEPCTPTEEEPNKGFELEDEEPDTNIWLLVKKASSDTDAVLATYGYGGFAPDEEQMVERHDVKLQGIEREKSALKYKGFQMLEERAKFTQNLLGDMEDMSDKKCPFIWESAYDEPSAQQEGIFQGWLVMQTFFEHIQVINSVDTNICVQEKPIGALIYSIQAVHCALLYSVTRTLKLPMDKKSAKFSKTNWGDHTLVTPHGEMVIKCASIFLSKISTLKDLQWDNIFNKVLAFQVTIRKQCTMAREAEVVQVGEVVESDSDDHKLLDPHYDTVPQDVEDGL